MCSKAVSHFKYAKCERTSRPTASCVQGFDTRCCSPASGCSSPVGGARVADANRAQRRFVMMQPQGCADVSLRRMHGCTAKQHNKLGIPRIVCKSYLMVAHTLTALITVMATSRSCEFVFQQLGATPLPLTCAWTRALAT